MEKILIGSLEIIGPVFQGSLKLPTRLIYAVTYIKLRFKFITLQYHLIYEFIQLLFNPLNNYNLISIIQTISQVVPSDLLSRFKIKSFDRISRIEYLTLKIERLRLWKDKWRTNTEKRYSESVKGTIFSVFGKGRTFFAVLFFLEEREAHDFSSFDIGKNLSRFVTSLFLLFFQIISSAKLR